MEVSTFCLNMVMVVADVVVALQTLDLLLDIQKLLDISLQKV